MFASSLFAYHNALLYITYTTCFETLSIVKIEPGQRFQGNSGSIFHTLNVMAFHISSKRSRILRLSPIKLLLWSTWNETASERAYKNGRASNSERQINLLNPKRAIVVHSEDQLGHASKSFKSRFQWNVSRGRQLTNCTLPQPQLGKIFFNVFMCWLKKFYLMHAFIWWAVIWRSKVLQC